MNFTLIILFLTVIYFPLHHAAESEAYLEPDQILTRIGASYVVMLKHDSITPVECYIHDVNKNLTYSVDLFQEGIIPTPVLSSNRQEVSSVPYIQPNADNQDYVTSIGNGICGFKMDTVSENTAKYWNISMIDQNKFVYYGTLRVIIRPVFPRHVTNYVKPGQFFQINCVTSDAGDLMNDLLYCELFNPQNEQIKLDTRSCKHVVEVAKVSDFGVWRCLQMFETHMLPNEVTYEYIPIKTDIVQTWSNTTDNHVNIGCKVTNATVFAQYCVMVRPDGNKIVLQPGLATKRYTAIGTNFKEHICAMQIELPLEETEKGLWRCEQWAQRYDLPIGGFINVSREDATNIPELKIPTQVFVHINATLTMTCAVPYSAPYCFMRGPDGSMYPLIDNKNSLGLCEFTKEKTQITDNGTWVCGFGKQTGERDDVYTFQVYVPEPVPVQPESQEIETILAGTARLQCSTRGLGDYPLQYCRFSSPEGNFYQIGDHECSDRMSYEGRGLEFGDCGITLHNVTEADQGIWSCITRIQKVHLLGGFLDTEEVYTSIHVTVHDNLWTSTAQSLV